MIIVSMSGQGDHAILYDAECAFCTRMLDLIMRRDQAGRLRAVPIQSGEGQRLLTAAGVPEAERLDSWHLAAPNGTITSGGAAGPALLRLLPAAGAAATLLATFPGATERAYRWIAGHRGLLGRFLVLCVLLLAAPMAAAGCGTTVQEGSKLTVYVSVPRSGPLGPVGDRILAGARAALADAGGEQRGAPVEIVPLDDVDGSGPDATWSQAQVAANARTATEDSASIAYIGDLESPATQVSTPITNEAGLLQVAPGPVERRLLAEPGGNDVPTHVQTSGTRTLGTTFSGDTAAGRQLANPHTDGYVAMQTILDSIDRAGDPLSRGDVINAFMSTSDLQTELGALTIGADGAAVYDSGQG